MTVITTGRRFGIIAAAGGLLLALTAPAAESAVGYLQLVSIGPGGRSLESSAVSTISGDGRYVAFQSPRDDPKALYVRDRSSGTTERVDVSSAEAPANGASWNPELSDNGRYVSFTSEATNLVPGDTDGVANVFLRDRSAGTTERLARTNAGYGSRISSDGRYVAFAAGGSGSWGTSTYVVDRTAGTTTYVARGTPGGFSANGQYLVVGSWDNPVVLYALGSGAKEVIADSGWGPDVSADGRYVVYDDQYGTEQVYVRDRTTGATELISQSTAGEPAAGQHWNGHQSQGGFISDDGRFVVFHSNAQNLVPGDVDGSAWENGEPRDVFLRDRVAGTTTLGSRNDAGVQANNYSGYPRLSADGRYVSFMSLASNLTPADATKDLDVFVAKVSLLTSLVSTLTPTADTYVDEQAKATNFATSKVLAARGAAGKGYTSYLRFSLPEAPAGKTLTGVTLRLRTAVDSFAGSTTSQDVRLVAGPWSETGTVFSNQPPLGATIGTLNGARSPAAKYTVTLDPAAVAGLLGKNLDIAVTGTSDSLWFRSRETCTPANRPTLTLKFTS